jgi:hypothetical protein
VVRSSYASLCLGLHISSYLVHSVVGRPQSLGKLKTTREEAAALLLLALPGTGELTRPSRPGHRAQCCPKAWAPRVLLRHSNGSSAGAPAAREWRRWCSSTPQNHRPGQLAAHIALGITWGGLVPPVVGDRGHRKGQLRVLGSPSARHTKEPRTGGPPGGHRGGGGSADPIFFCESPFVHI